MAIRPIHYIRDERGTTAVEFAFVGPIFMMCMVGLVYVGLMLFSYSSMQDAVEQSARCWAVNTTSCGSASATQTYAGTIYYGLNAPAPTFTATTAACGFQVAGTMSFKVNWVLGKATVPLSATACFP